MARIRSIHPPIWTDETFAALSDPASLLLIGLWTEADDNGVFEWKPVTLKMRLRPVKNETLSDLSGLLDELVEAKMIRKFVVEDRPYGSIRNFLRFQRPKQPKATFPFPVSERTYVGFSSEGLRPRSGTGRPPASPGYEEAPASETPTSELKSRSKRRTSEVVRNQFGSTSEVGCQREEEGGRRKDGGGKMDDEGGKGEVGTQVSSEPEILPDDFVRLMLSVRTGSTPDGAAVVDATVQDLAGKDLTDGDDVQPEGKAQRPAKSAAEKEYAFEAGPIRLNDRDWKRWKEAYPSINLAGELTSMAPWAQRLKDEGKNWFEVLPNQLIKLERTARSDRENARIKAEAEAKAGINKSQRAGRPAI